MQKLKLSLFIVLLLYTSAIFYIEITTSQDYVRNYLTDINGPVFFYGVNTTLSTFFLWATALVFIIVFLFKHTPKEKYFYISQIIFFVWIGLDDRFQIHEMISDKLLIFYAIIEICLIGLFWEFINKKSRKNLIIGCVLLSLMLIVDFFLPAEMVLRLSSEDLLKIWAHVFLFLYSWEILKQKIDRALLFE